VKKDKKSIRHSILSRRKNLSEDVYRSLSAKVCHRLQNRFLTGYKRVMGFVPVNNEVYITPLLYHILETGVLILPKVVNQDIKPVKVDDLGCLVEGYKGIPEPADSEPAADIDIILVPGIAFGKSGRRIGYGGGFYDRFFAETKSVLVAPAFSFQIIKQICADSFDIPVDFIVTEQEIIRCNDFNKGEDNG